MPILRIRKGFTLTHGQSVYLAGDVIECTDAFAANVSHMVEPAPATETKRAKLIREAIEPVEARRTARSPAAA